jgi:hypothetical protein
MILKCPYFGNLQIPLNRMNPLIHLGLTTVVQRPLHARNMPEKSQIRVEANSPKGARFIIELSLDISCNARNGVSS